MAMATATVAMLLGAGGTGLNVFGQWKAGAAAARAGEKQQEAADSAAELYDFNAGVAEIQAADAITRGELEEQRFRGMVRQAVGTQRAGYAASNVDVNYGSAVDVQADTARLGELDALTIRTNAAREAWGYKVEAYDARKRAEITRKEGIYAAEAGRSSRTTARLGAATSLIGGTYNLLEARYGFGRK